MSPNHNNRDLTFDIMKGVGILLVMAGHYWPESLWPWAHKTIYSFHVPLFFLVAGYFAKPPKVGLLATIKKNAKRLLLPFVFTQLLLVVYGAIQAIAKHDASYAIAPGLSLIWAANDGLNSQWGLICIGPMWFLLALFWGKTLFELLISKLQGWRLLFVCFAISFASVLFRKYVYSPWCVFEGLYSLIFLCLGYMAKKSEIPQWFYYLALILWPIAVIVKQLDISVVFIVRYLLSVFGACGGTLFVWFVSSWLNRIGILSKPIGWIGLFSLVVLCFHNFEWYTAIPYSIVIHMPFEINGSWMLLFRFVLTIILVLIAVNTPAVRDIYGAPKRTKEY